MPDESVLSKQVLTVCQQINNALVQLTNQNESLRLQLQSAAIELALAATEAVLNKSTDESSLPLDGIIRQLVDELGSDTAITVSLHPHDYANVMKQTKDSEFAGELSNLKIVASADIPQGTCRAANSMNTLRTDVLTRLVAIRERWMESLNVSRTGHRSTDTIS